MGQDAGDAGQFEWVNTWASLTKAEAASVDAAREAVSSAMAEPVAPAIVAAAIAAPLRAPLADDQLMRDIAEIERARDALAALPVSGSFSARRAQALTLVPSRTSDNVPVVVGGVLALVMLTVFGAAAAMTKLAR